jgi:hypothetical protein
MKTWINRVVNYFSPTKATIYIIFLAFILSACGGGGDGGSSSNSGGGGAAPEANKISGKAMLGPIHNARVHLYDQDGALLATTVTENDGSYSTEIGAYSGTLRVMISPLEGSDSFFICDNSNGCFDESGQYVYFGEAVRYTSTLQAVVSSAAAAGAINVTPFTTMVAERALALSANDRLSSGHIDAANQELSEALSSLLNGETVESFASLTAVDLTQNQLFEEVDVIDAKMALANAALLSLDDTPNDVVNLLSAFTVNGDFQGTKFGANLSDAIIATTVRQASELSDNNSDLYANATVASAIEEIMRFANHGSSSESMLIANVGRNQIVNANQTVFLTGSVSSDRDEAQLRYVWEQVSGSSVTLSDSTILNPTFIASGDISNHTRLAFRLTVSAVDNAMSIVSDIIVIQVHPIDTPVDTTPETFNFPDQTDVSLNQTRTSEITVSGINAPAQIAITGAGEYRIDGGAFTDADGVVSDGQVLEIRLVSASTVSTTVETTMTIGGVSDIFSVSTEAATLPNAFSFAALMNVELNALQESQTVTISGLNTPLSITVEGGEYRIGDGEYSSSPSAIQNNQTLTLRVQSSLQFLNTASATVTIGGEVSATFNVTTLAAADTTPDAFSFPAVDNAALSAEVISASATISGINSPTEITVTGGSYRINGGSFTSDLGQMSNGDSVDVQLTASAQAATLTGASVTIGGVSATFNVTTLAADTTPNAFSFQSVDNAALDSVVTSASATISGINSPTEITVAGGSYRINGGSFTSDLGQMSNGDSVDVQLTASAQAATLTGASVTIGGVSATFSVTTLAADTTPDAFSFPAVDNAALSAEVISASATISGINAPAPITITGAGEYRIDDGAFTDADGVVSNGQVLEIRLVSASTVSTTVEAAVTIGGISDVFSIITGSAPAFTLAPTPAIVVTGQASGDDFLVSWNNINASRYRVLFWDDGGNLLVSPTDLLSWVIPAATRAAGGIVIVEAYDAVGSSEFSTPINVGAL